METIEVGQNWYWHSSSVADRPFLSIMKIESCEASSVVHISVHNLNLEGEKYEISHLPIDMKIIKGCVFENFGMNKKTNSAFEEAYELWKTSKGGIWKIPLDQIIELTFKALS